MNLQRLRTLNRSCQVHLVLFSSVFYGGYALFIFLQKKLLFNSRTSPFSLSFLFLFPFGIFYIKKLVHSGFLLLMRRRQAALEIKQAELKDRIEELKVETGYYATKNLIEKYGETELKQRPVSGKGNEKGLVSSGPNALNSGNNLTLIRPNIKGISHKSPPSSPPQIPNPSPPPRPFKSPTWMDRFMDALIGDDSRNQKYALICAQCFNHNGLASPEAFDFIRYRCPNCGFMNGSLSVKKTSGIESKIEELPESNEIQMKSTRSE